MAGKYKYVWQNIKEQPVQVNQVRKFWFGGLFLCWNTCYTVEKPDYLHFKWHIHKEHAVAELSMLAVPLKDLSYLLC